MTAPVDLSKIKPGDEVLVRLKYQGLTALGDVSGWRHLTNGAAEILNVHTNDFVSHTPKALAVGDRVQIPERSGGVILGIDGTDAWVRYPEGRGIYLLSDLVRA